MCRSKRRAETGRYRRCIKEASRNWPSGIRRILRRQRNTRVVLGEVTSIDPKRREVMIGAQAIAYDYLILATGARHAYFGHDDWEPFAPGLKQIDDATHIRRRILMAFEHAETEPEAIRRRQLLTFVVIGGGPTGVELAGTIAELARKALAADFRRIDPTNARIVLIRTRVGGVVVGHAA